MPDEAKRSQIYGVLVSLFFGDCMVMDCRYFAGKTWLNNVERDYQTYRLCKSRLLKFKFIVYYGLRLHHACGNDIIAKLGSGIVRKSSRAIKAKINGSYRGKLYLASSHEYFTCYTSWRQPEHAEAVDLLINHFTFLQKSLKKVSIFNAFSSEILQLSSSISRHDDRLGRMPWKFKTHRELMKAFLFGFLYCKAEPLFNFDQ